MAGDDVICIITKLLVYILQSANTRALNENVSDVVLIIVKSVGLYYAHHLVLYALTGFA